MLPISEALRRRSGQPSEPAFDRLLRAGRDRFSRDGYSATSLDAVAAAGGVTKGSLYHHFSGKAGLFEAVFEAEARRVTEQVAHVVARERDPRKGADAGVRAFLEAAQDPAVQRIMFLDAPSVLGWTRVREIDAQYGLALVRLALEQLIAGGQMRRRDVEVLSHLLFGALLEGAQLIARAENPAATRRKVERELRQLLDGLALQPS
jgi:AcrR family transcriptional regulator